MHTMQVIQVVNGAFHHFDLARELEARECLQRIYSGFPWRRLKREGVSRDRVSTFPWIHTPLFLSERYLPIPQQQKTRLDYYDWVLFDAWVSSQIGICDVVVGLSGAALKTGRLVQSRGGKYVCDRGSSHIRFQDAILHEEYAKWGFPFAAVDSRVIAREEMEYDQADAIFVPSGFAQRSFIKMGIAAEKVKTIPYGVRLERFQRTG